LQIHVYGPEVDLTFNRNEYQKYFLARKDGRCIGLTTLSLSDADFLEVWEPQLLETLRVCAGPYRKCFTLYCADMPSV
jgi:hypothetical protein